MRTDSYTIVGLGEILWDLFRKRKQLGGAPANFAYMINLLGDRAKIASRVGRDSLGNEAIRILKSLHLDVSHLQEDGLHSTGIVIVSLNSKGQPEYEITDNVAWDFLEQTDDLENLAREADAVCFGSLAQRSPVSRETISAFLHLLRPGALRVFDVNLRQKFFTREILDQSTRSADIMKCNHEEVVIVARLLGCAGKDLNESAQKLLRAYPLKLLCVTRGEHGSILFSSSGIHVHPGHRVKVVDTVGAGDAFTAGLVHHYLRGSSLEMINEASNRMGAWLASQSGATPTADPVVLEKVRAGTGSRRRSSWLLHGRRSR
ncbi:MAG TPA: carbohydrate kinase [Candidatus Acidoferrum sp.]|jgi:fructokinase